MELFNVGIGELLVILVIMYVLLGPQGMLRAARWLGHASRQVTRFFTESWRSITDLPMDIRELPRVLMEESGLEETFEEIKQDTRAVQADLEQTIGPVKRIALPDQTSTKPRASKMAASAEPQPGEAVTDATLSGPLKEAQAPVYAGKYDLKITPVQGAVPATAVPPAAVADSAPPADPPKRGRGRPRKGEPRPEPKPDQPKRKRGRPPKNRPEATAAEAGPHNGSAAQSRPPVKERPGQPAEKLPRHPPSQPGDPVASRDPQIPLDLDEHSGARAFPNNPAPASLPNPRQTLPPEETPDTNDV